MMSTHTEHTAATLTLALVSRLDAAEDLATLRQISGGRLRIMHFHDDRAGLVDAGRDAAIVYGNVRPHEVEHLPHLQWVHATWSGVDNLMHAPLINSGAIITNTRGQVGEAMSEHALAAVLYLGRDFPAHVQASAARQWRVETDPLLIQRATVAVLGTGAIAEHLVPRLVALGMRVIGVNSDGRPFDGCERCTTLEQVHPLLSDCDMLISLLPAADHTHKVIDGAMLDALKPGAGVINLSRGSVLDADALLARIDRGHLRGAVLDVTDPEPLPADAPLFGHPRVLITGHRSWQPVTDRGRREGFEVFACNLRHFLAGRLDQMQNRVDPARGY